MRITFFILSVVVAMFGQAIARETSVLEFRLNVNPEKLALRRDGIFLKTEGFGEIFLSNIQVDKRGYYTTCQITCSCAHCYKEFKKQPFACDCCGSRELSLIGVGENKGSHYLTIEGILCASLGDPALWTEEGLLCSTKIEGSGTIDNEGNRSLSIDIDHKNEDQSLDYGGGGSIRQDSEGNTTLEFEFRASYEF